jgi:hypothetical protein
VKVRGCVKLRWVCAQTSPLISFRSALNGDVFVFRLQDLVEKFICQRGKYPGRWRRGAHAYASCSTRHTALIRQASVTRDRSRNSIAHVAHPAHHCELPDTVAAFGINCVNPPGRGLLFDLSQRVMTEVDPASETTGAGLLVGSAAAPTS